MTQLFQPKVIAIIWDFDQTLIPGHMQAPLFEFYGVDEQQFWKEVRGLSERYRQQGHEQISEEVLYLNHILDYVREGRFGGLNNEKLRELGAKLEFYPGLPEFFESLKEVVKDKSYQDCNIKVEHYVVSAGLAEMIRGSALNKYIDGVWACGFIDNEEGTQLSKIIYVLDDTSKTRAVFEINKGCNLQPEIKVNSYMKESERRVPIGQMIYIADGPSDVPVFSLVEARGGYTYIVYNPEQSQAYDKAYDLVHNQMRAKAMGKADYRPDSDTANWLKHTVKQIAKLLLKRHNEFLKSNVGEVPRHVND